MLHIFTVLLKIDLIMEHFLKLAKGWSRDLKTFESVNVVLGNEAGDLDSVVSAIVYAFHLYWTSLCKRKGCVVFPVININREDFPLRTEVTYTCKRFEINWENLIFINDINLQDLDVASKLKIYLVDHNILSQHQLGWENSIVEIIDHHKDATPALAAYKKTIEQVGSCATLIAERLIDAQAPAFDTQTAGLLIATILLDTINLEPEAGRMTSKDVEVVDRLKTYCADELSTDELYHAVTAAKFDVSCLTTIDLLRKDFKIVPQGQKPVKVCISSVSLPLGDFFSRENAHKDTEKFCSILNLDVLVLMPIYFEPKSDIPKRQIGVCGPSMDAVKQVADYLASSSELRLSPISTGQLPGWAAYDQGNATASRKVVFPLVMKFLSGLK